MTSQTPESPEPQPHSLRDAITQIEDRIEHAVEDAVHEAQELEPLVAQARRATWFGHLGRWWPLLLAAIMMIAIISSGALNELTIESLATRRLQLVAFADAWPIGSRIALLGATVLVVCAGLPGSAGLATVGGLIIGTWQSALLVTLGDAIGAAYLYFSVRRVIAGDRRAPALVESLRAGFARHPASYAIFLRLVPIAPFAAVSIALVWLGCSLRTFLVTSFVGIAPINTIYAWFGAGLAATLARHGKVSSAMLAEPRFMLPLIALATLALLPVLLGLRKRSRSGNLSG